MKSEEHFGLKLGILNSKLDIMDLGVIIYAKNVKIVVIKRVREDKTLFLLGNVSIDDPYFIVRQIVMVLFDVLVVVTDEGVLTFLVILEQV